MVFVGFEYNSNKIRKQNGNKTFKRLLLKDTKSKKYFKIVHLFCRKLVGE